MTESERLVLAEIGRPDGGSIRTPQDIAGQINVTKGTNLTWQGVAATARRLKQRGYIRIYSSRITWYEITDAGREELGMGQHDLGPHYVQEEGQPPPITKPVTLVIDEAAELLKRTSSADFQAILREGRKP